MDSCELFFPLFVVLPYIYWLTCRYEICKKQKKQNKKKQCIYKYIERYGSDSY